ncbi:MAG TPA: nucleoside triphosphate pyrophosphohydrolase family protein [Candidatus Saccharimonadales bacterium]|nr:nucleoside triphosphate pyrophosphohydrolase family protein [Candidatus Saccharimonadales bacterium]
MASFNDYQQQALTTAVHHDNPQMDKSIFAMGIAGEAGEVIEKWKKIVAYRDGVVTDEDKQELSKELGDVLWYIAVFAHELGVDLDDIVDQNLAKLASRKERNVIKGQGDNR